jgi:hypothetical protein
MSETSMRTYFVGVDAWIIQDGNYGDFHVGEVARFALEICPSETKMTTRRDISSTRIRASQYSARGKVVYADSSAWVLEFGVMAYAERKSHCGIQVGDWIETELYLGIDYFIYMEEMHARHGMPNLQYEWRIHRILRNATPLMNQKDAWGRVTQIRDLARESFVEVAATDAWNDDEGQADYVLECERIE